MSGNCPERGCKQVERAVPGKPLPRKIFKFLMHLDVSQPFVEEFWLWDPKYTDYVFIISRGSSYGSGRENLFVRMPTSRQQIAMDQTNFEQKLVELMTQISPRAGTIMFELYFI